MKTRTGRRCILTVFLAAVCTSCGSSPLEPPSGDGGGWDGAAGEVPALETGADAVPVDSVPGGTCRPERKETYVLTNTQYNLTVRDLLGDVSFLADQFEPDEYDQLGFLVPKAKPTATKRAQFEAAADVLARTALSNVRTLLPCDPAVIGDEQCMLQFISTFGLRAFRRPLTSDEVETLRKTFPVDIGPRSDIVRAVVAAFLKSEHFYQVEVDSTEGRPATLNDYEIASRLSYFIYRSMPDAELFAAAAAGQLRTAEGVLQQARRMLKDEKALSGVIDVVDTWLDLRALDRLAEAPMISLDQALLYRQMREETLRFVESIFFGGGGVDQLFRGTDTWLTDGLATVYGVPGISSPTFQPGKLDPTVRSGLLTEASLLTLTSVDGRTSPSRRGTFVLGRLACIAIPQPPNTGLPMTATRNPGETTRQAWERAVASNPVCRACHVPIDNIGFALEAFDAGGRFRRTEDGIPIDTAGRIEMQTLIGSFNDAVQLAKLLVDTSSGADCVQQRWQSAAFPGISLLFDQVAGYQTASIKRGWKGGSLQELVEAIVVDNAFRYAYGCGGRFPVGI